MTLQSYLSSGAVEDVRTAIELGITSSWDLEDIGKPGIEIEQAPDGAWTLIMVSCGTKSEVCYYREQSGSYIVSDCGETVSEVMRRTGLREHEAQLEMKRALFGTHHKNFERVGELVLYAPNWSIHVEVDSVSDLPAAIVSVLGAVAKVRERLDKEQS